MIVFLNIHYVLHAGLENLSELLSELQVSDFFFIQYETIYFTELFNYCSCYHYWNFKLVTLMLLILQSLAIES